MCVTSDRFAILSPSTWDHVGEGLRAFQQDLRDIPETLVVHPFAESLEKMAVLLAVRSRGCLGEGFPILAVDVDPTFQRALRKMFLWQGAFAEALMRAYGFAQRGEARMARHWYACAKRRAAFVVEAQATAIALASK